MSADVLVGGQGLGPVERFPCFVTLPFFLVGNTQIKMGLEEIRPLSEHSLVLGNRPVHIVTRDGKVIDGRRLNEDTYTVQIADEEGRLLSLAKADLREFKISTKSPMPSYKGELTPEELADLVSYLLSLKDQ